ncbi:glycosyltransferase family 1 protein (plasmid) [Leisingera sp. M527]|uniref:glycosyltransferase family protein n=1 Tax=Leisingera sp. M527 TaxID=2867014 RepID=UPI0021A41979|nr:glycosyltransferase [Leisingera sp. M527]UWQ35129.1 glycosyltransferase family 1 protein [Leisingera sp. M527]
MLDAACVIDPRFCGGTAAAMASDIAAFLNAGLRVGLAEVRSPYLDGAPERRSPAIAALCQDPRIERLEPSADRPITARSVFLHHPMTFFYGIRTPLRLRAEKTFLVAHHLPFRGDGSLQYDPIATAHRVARATGARPLWLPVSGLCRQQLRSFTPFIRLGALDWPNVFDPAAWTPARQAFSSRRLVIGRHGRADPLKWPDTAAGIAASLPRLPDTEIRVMGCPRADLEQMGADLSDWTVLDFDAQPVPGFLDGLDVFVYHFHPASSESFGRTVAEAMLMGAVCVLDPRLAPTFGDLALYCPPEGTAGMIEKLRRDPAAARAVAARARAAIAQRHSLASVPERLAALHSAGPAAAPGPRYAPPLEVLRKTLGMIRRGEYFPSHLAARRRGPGAA